MALSVRHKVGILSKMTTENEAGVHFTRIYTDEVLSDLESSGLIVISRPIHQPTGISYDQEHWHVEVTQEGLDLVDAFPEYWS